MVVSGRLKAPDVGTEGLFAVSGVLLKFEGGQVGCLLGGVVQTSVDCCRDSSELVADSGFLGRYGCGTGNGAESPEVDTRAIRVLYGG